MLSVKNLLFGLVLCLTVIITGCRSTYKMLRAEPPKTYTAFLPRHDLLKKEPSTFPFRRFWERPDINWRKYQYIYVAPVDVSHLIPETTWNKMNFRTLTREQFEKGMSQINSDAIQIGQYMRKQFIKSLKKEGRRIGLTVMPDAFPGCLILRLSLVKIVPTKVFLNAGGIVANIFLPGSGVVANVSSSGIVGVEGMVMEDSGRMLMMFAEQDKNKMTLVDVDGLTWYSHAKYIITTWSKDFCNIIKNPNYKQVKTSFPARLY